MFCSNCGSQISDSDAYCSNCGTKVLPTIPKGETEESKGFFGDASDVCGGIGLILGLACAYYLRSNYEITFPALLCYIFLGQIGAVIGTLVGASISKIISTKEQDGKMD